MNDITIAVRDKAINSYTRNKDNNLTTARYAQLTEAIIKCKLTTLEFMWANAFTPNYPASVWW